MEKSGKHIHHGRSSKEIIDSSRVLKAIELKEGDILLDAGSGDGYMSLAASEVVGEKGEVYSVDIYEESMNILIKEIEIKNIRNIMPIIADISKKLPIKDGTVDICYMANVLHGFVENGNVDRVMREVKRIIRPKGIFAIVEFKKVPNTPGPPMNVRITPKIITKIVEKHSMTFKKVEEVGDYHYAVIIEKS